MKVDWSECDNERVVTLGDCKTGDVVVLHKMLKTDLWLVVETPGAPIEATKSQVVCLGSSPGDGLIQRASVDSVVTRYQARVVVEKRL